MMRHLPFPTLEKYGFRHNHFPYQEVEVFCNCLMPEMYVDMIHNAMNVKNGSTTPLKIVKIGSVRKELIFNLSLYTVIFISLFDYEVSRGPVTGRCIQG